jgi:hypothetical protein
MFTRDQRSRNYCGRFKSRVAGSEGCFLEVKGTPVAGSNECPFFTIVRYCSLLRTIRSEVAAVELDVEKERLSNRESLMPAVLPTSSSWRLNAK